MSEKICRLCLCQPVVSVSLLENNGVEMYETLTSLKIVITDSIPKSACVKCWLNLKCAYHIQQGFLEADRKLHLIEFETSDDDRLPKKTCDEDFDDSLFPSESNTDDMIIIKGEIQEEVEEFENEIIDETTIDEHEEELAVKTEFNKNSQFNCIICGDNLTEDSIESHIKEHFCNVQYCDECDKRFDNLQSYKIHVIQDHDEQFRTWRCSYCDASFQYKSFYHVHMEKAHADKLNASKKVKNAKRPATIEDTLADESTNGMYRCPECNKVFDNNRKFESHIKVHRRKKCHICNVMITISNLKKHIIAHSAGPSVCHLCGATCKNQDSLRGHLYYTHSTNSYPCEHCGKIFKKNYSRLLHVKKEHTGEKNHICDTCGKGFFTHYCLNKHIRMTHMKLRPYICEHCKKGFSSKFALRTHVRQHTNDAPYKCSICGEGFRQNVSLRSHKKSKHDIIEEKNCECKVCGKKFVSNWAVQSHMRLH